MKCCNLSRTEAKNNTVELNPDKNAWISIMEPDNDHIENEFMDRLPNLKMKFWDVTHRTSLIGTFWGENTTAEYADPISDEQVRELYNFLILHKDKNIYVNCLAGVSRSAAICQFLEDILLYEWDRQFKNRSIPNSYIYKKLVDMFMDDCGNKSGN